ncbi:MAG TPA: indolepyruvate oxidoreductase subunit beta family protein [Candidatus Acidoferrum sp.]|jgi:indolepyruvate ferredoxin oxidoreductase beta subunit
MGTSATYQSIDTNAGSPSPRAITIAIVAMGGEGGGVLADWIVDLAERAGYLAQTTSVPGVAQRTGSTIYYIEIFPEASAAAARKLPVFALMPVPGELDIVLASELMEAGRAIQRGFVTSDRTTLISSTHRVYSMTEKIALGDGQVDSKQLIEAGATAARVFVHRDFERIARETRSVISAALFGALAATGALPFSRAQFEDAIRRGGVGVESSLAGFAASFDATLEPIAQQSNDTAKHSLKVGVQLQPLAARIESQFPPASHAILFAAVQKLADYQDVSYASTYLDELAVIRDVDTKNGNGAFVLLSETARYLALWMSYEDAVRVADLKTRDARFARVHHDSRAGNSELIQIKEFLHPGVEEITDILPAGIGGWMRNSGAPRKIIEKFAHKGRIVNTTSLFGFLQLYALAALRPLRRKSLRFREEHIRIKQWLAQIVEVAKQNYPLALELAECPCVVKGYGDTHIRGRKSFDTLMSTLPKLVHSSDSARILKICRDAALADDTGDKLTAALRELPA